jgi:hypothetical protein
MLCVALPAADEEAGSFVVCDVFVVITIVFPFLSRKSLGKISKPARDGDRQKIGGSRLSGNLLHRTKVNDPKPRPCMWHLGLRFFLREFAIANGPV